MTGLLEGRVAVVTGGGRGIGRAHCLELARHGAALVVNDVDSDAAAEVVGEVEAAGGLAWPDSTSVADFDAVGDSSPTPCAGMAVSTWW